jgi:hypothetical protein
MTGWMHWVSTLPLAWMVPAILMGSCALSWVMVSQMRRWLPHPVFKENNEFVGFTYAIFGLIYGVLLAFTIITAWERFSKTEQMVMHEATTLSKLWRYSEAFPANSGAQIQHLLIDYTLSLLVLLSLQYPFTGDVSISPNAMQTLLDSFQERIGDRN